MESPTTPTRARCLTVRFEDSCILIPPSEPHSKLGLRPRLVRKSYSLPLWKTTPLKKTGAASTGPATDVESVVEDVDKTGKKTFSLTVSIPSLTTRCKPPRSSIPQSPCLSKRSPDSPVSLPPLQALNADTATSPLLFRTHTLPAIEPASVSDGFTVPLRACCEACHSCVDAALAEGDDWDEKWSLGAMRRHREGAHAKLHALHLFGVTHEWKPNGADISLLAALQVDEVEAKRRASPGGQGTPCMDEDPLADSDEEGAALAVPPTVFQEDEDQLFPLPSPRRSPNRSPCDTPTSGSQVNLASPPTALDPTSARVESPGVASASAPNLTIPVSQLPALTSPDPDCPISPDVAACQTPQQRTADQGSSPRPHRHPRPMLSSASVSLLKGSAAVLRGVAAGMTNVTVGVVR